jgi:predicted small integral membrane protein
VTTDPAWLSADARYWIGYAPQFALVAGLLVGTLVWRRLASPAGTPRRGALVGAAIAVGTLLVVPILAGLYVAAFPVVLGVFTGAEWGTVARVVPGYLQASLGVTQTVALGWSPVVAVVLVPLGALGGWVSQRLGRPGR